MTTQQELDTTAGIHNSSGYDQSGGRLGGGTVDTYGKADPYASTITPASLTPATPVNYQTSPQLGVPDVSSLGTEAPKPLVDPNTQPSQATPFESKLSSMYDALQAGNTALSGEAAYKAQQNEALGVNSTSDAITGLNSRLTSLINEGKAIPLAVQQNAQEGGANVTKGGLAPIQTAQLRNNAIQSLAASSQIDALNGQLTNAMAKVDRAVNLKYGQIEADNATLTKNLQLALQDPTLTREQADRANKKLAEVKAYDAQIADKKKNETDTHDAILTVLHNNSGNKALTDAVVNVLNAAQSPAEVAALVNKLGLSNMSQQDAASLASAQQGTLASQQSVLSSQQSMKLAAQKSPYELALLQAQTSKAQADAKKAATAINDNGDTVNSLAQQLADGTLAPSELSKRTSGAGANYNAILTAAGKLLGTNGKPVNIAQLDRQYKYATNVQTQNTLNYLGSLVGGNGQTGNLDDLKTISNAIDRTQFPALNDVEAWAKLQTGNPQIVAYNATVTEVADQIAKILQGGGTGSGTSDAKLAQASALFQKSFTKEQINATIDAIKPLLVNRGKNIVKDNPYLKDYADQFGYSKSSGNDNQQPDLSAWIAQPNYNQDIQDAKDAIAAGADKAAVLARLQQKYKDVSL